jgi:glycogen debranching enzyme
MTSQSKTSSKNKRSGDQPASQAVAPNTVNTINPIAATSPTIALVSTLPDSLIQPEDKGEKTDNDDYLVEVDRRLYGAADQFPIPSWGCSFTERMQQTLTVKDDDLFLITDTLGNISGCLDDGVVTSMGLFCRDSRFLSRLELQINHRSPILLSSTAQRGFSLSVLCANPRLDEVPAETIGIQRELVLNGGLFEEITLTNFGSETVKFELSLSFDADFTDLFEIRGFDRKEHGQLLRRVVRSEDETAQSYALHEDPSEMSMAYQGLDGSIMESHIQFFHNQPQTFKGYTAVWSFEMESHTTERLSYRISLLTNSQPVSRVPVPMTLVQAKAAEMMEEQEWRALATQIRTDNKAINQVIERAEQDIYLLRQTFEQGKVLSAGVPWFCTLFGRDSIIAASQSLILNPVIARDTLTVLAHYQGKQDDDWREEEPGKILHEIRLGELARCEKIPHTPYYGTVDATPLWLMLYAEYYAWTGDRDTLEKLWENALLAMAWVDRELKETGYLSYNKRSKRGLVNQGWKDSGDCIVDRNGKMATGPIALCEVQGYVYAAKIRMSELAHSRKRPDLGDRWSEEAEQLKARFNVDFWMEEEGFIALALDGEGKQVDSITSNPGHCLNLGILDIDKANSVSERLQAPDMFNGWGIRTLSSFSPAYNPMGYHLGSVWPHDNGMIALGLRSLGHVDHSLELGQALLDMTLRQPYQRPPELLCGYERQGDSDPVRYPVACSPQAWATGTVFQLLQMMTNLVPDAPGNCLRIIDPALPTNIQHLTITNLHVGSTLVDLEFIRQGSSSKERSGTTTSCRVIRKRGNLRVVIEA